ncbi:phosphate acetyltransferase [Chitinophaga costaii]|uniref:Phosphate acetyltransferase n=1 Tax=Chitinophaga costaii TaxID=1335309 RepID=A0A1C4EGU1_9BACT|nr:phosphate acetyltransferase [Chitinophaga costaii]PUZ23833.1 phosphate acetyltransferase [Chitinophaga costaii]SCC42809.1 phosphate acetyltransferase [Chitinophaga costaii]
MTKSIFIASAEPYSGKSMIILGLADMLLGRTQKIGYLKPVVLSDTPEQPDPHISTVLSYFQLKQTYAASYVFTRQETMQQLKDQRQGAMIDAIITRYKALEAQYDFIVVEGSDYVGQGAAFEFETNRLIAKNLNTPALLLISGENKTPAEIIQEGLNFCRAYQEHDIQVLAVVANKVAPEQEASVRQLLAAQLPEGVLAAVVPMDAALQNPTVGDVFAQLKGRLLFGQEYLGNQVDHFVTGAMQVPNFLHYLKENVLIVTPGDRGDIIISSLQANLSSSYPRVAGIVLTADTIPEAPVMRLIEGLQNVVPIMAVRTGTFETTHEVAQVKARITPDNPHKIQLAIETFNRFIDVAALDKKIITYHSDAMTPHMFQYQLAQWAKREKKTIVLPEGNDDRILIAAARLLAQQLVNLVLLGNVTDIAASVKRLGIDLDVNTVPIIDPATSAQYDDYVNTLYELRKNKNLTLETARDLMTDVSYFGTMMVYKGHADGMVSGAVHTTQHTIRPALQFIKTRPGISTVSSIFFMCLADRVSVFGDCAVNPNPTAEQLAEIAISSADNGARFGITPRIAMLSYSSGTSGEGEDVDKVRRATQLVRAQRPDLKVEGPIQYDAAVDPAVGRQKLPGSEVAGQASVLIFPDLNTGNNTYKAVQRETGALAIGPMLQGLNKPVNDLSRGCTVDDVFNTVIITAIQSQPA